LVQADLETLPFRHQSVGAAWARAAYLHVPAKRLPTALAQLHHSMAVRAPLVLSVHRGAGESVLTTGDIPGRFFARWEPEDLGAALAGAGFVVERLEADDQWVWADARRERTLPDFVAPGMRLLVCGLNPSLVAADAGYGYAGRTNRFWPAALEAGIVTRPRQPFRALAHDGVGMTDLVKRATPGASVIEAGEYDAGTARVRRMVEWLRPAAVLFVGLAGWRSSVDRGARAGLQSEPFGGCPAYVMPSTSGLNARAPKAELVAHMASAMALARRSHPERPTDPSAH
jgi:TDG/mug DNA glycosylase family protein